MSNYKPPMAPPARGAARGPGTTWGNWRNARTKRIENPRRNKAAQKLAASKPKEP